MREAKVDLWECCAWGICITTNGYVKPNGQAVMGRGCALEAKQRIPGIDKMLGAVIRKFGNHVYPIGTFGGTTVYSFPVKHNWWEKADIELIKRSCKELREYAYGDRVIVLPRPGCGNGHLDWKEVQPVIAPLLPDNVVVISK